MRNLRISRLFLTWLGAMLPAMAYGQDSPHALIGPTRETWQASPVRLRPEAPTTLTEYLMTDWDIVVEGTVLACCDTTRRYAGAPLNALPLNFTEIQLHINRVIKGVAKVAADTTLAVSLIEHGWFNHDPVGDKVTVQAFRSEPDGWRLHGHVIQFSANGELIGYGGRPLSVVCPSLSGTIQREDYQTVIEQLQEQRDVIPFNGRLAIALAKVTKSSGWTLSGLTLEVDSLGWVLGQGLTVPRRVHIRRLVNCYPQVFPRDSMLIVVREGFRGEQLEAETCLDAWRIKKGFVPALGNFLPEIDRAFEYDVSAGFTLRSFTR